MFNRPDNQVHLPGFDKGVCVCVWVVCVCVCYVLCVCVCYSPTMPLCKGFPGSSDGKESTCNAGDLGSIPGSRRSLGEGIATHSSILAWKIPWTEELGGLQSMGLQRLVYIYI